MPLSHSTHPTPAVRIGSPLTGSPPSAGPWKQWQKDLLVSADKEKVSAEPLALMCRNLLAAAAAAAGLDQAGIAGRNLPDGPGLTGTAAGSAVESMGLPDLESEVADAGKETIWMVVETAVRSKIPRTLRRKLGCDGEGVSAVTAGVGQGFACKTIRANSAEVLQSITHQPSCMARCRMQVHVTAAIGRMFRAQNFNANTLSMKNHVKKRFKTTNQLCGKNPKHNNCPKLMSTFVQRWHKKLP